MIQPRPLTGSSSTTPSESPATPSRAGQVPRGGRPLQRLCILSVPATRAAAGLDWEAIAAEQRRLAGLGFGIAVGIEPGERSALRWDDYRELVQKTGKLGLAQGFLAGAASDQAGNAIPIGEQIDAIVEQSGAIEEAGGVPLLLPLPTLSRRRAREDEYV